MIGYPHLEHYDDRTVLVHSPGVLRIQFNDGRAEEHYGPGRYRKFDPTGHCVMGVFAPYIPQSIINGQHGAAPTLIGEQNVKSNPETSPATA